ncbi:MAG TPA: type I methionyl aminopeptidase [Chloroflexota bacterium]|nr:type I methionyl aminopeptidase [Chloroflexota bacterium]
MVAKTKRDVQGMRRANQVTARLLRELTVLAQPGMRTRDLDNHAVRYIQRAGGEAVFHTQNHFPAAINTSVNDEAVHGVPGDRVLRAGDLLKIDCGIRLDGYCGDTTASVIVGDGTEPLVERAAVLAGARDALDAGIAAVRVGGRVSDIGHAIERVAHRRELRVLRQFTGHGIGHRLWEQPSIPAFGAPGTGAVIVDGMVFTIEPILTSGDGRVYLAPDGWTVRTVDGAPVAQFEHTVMATRAGPRILSVVSSR